MRRHRPGSAEVDSSWDYRSSGQSKSRERTRRRRNRGSSRSRRSRSSSTSSTGSSSRSSHSSSSRRSDYGRKRSGSRSPKHHSGDKYRSSSSPRSNRSNLDPRYPIKDGVSDHNHGNWYQNQSYAPGQEGYPQHMSSSYSSSVTGNFNYQNQGFGNNYHQGYPGYESSSYYQGTEFQQQPSHDYVTNLGSSSVQSSNWDAPVVYPDISKPPPSHLSTQPASAVEQELLHQKRTLAKQREDYIKRKISLNRELSRLKDQKRELLQEHSKDNERILRENAKLQNEILQKLKSIDNVIEMLSGIIGDAAELPEVIKGIMAMETPKKSDKRRHSDSPDSNHKKLQRKTSESPSATPKSPSETKGTGGVNLVHYDPELHWCPDCDAFPRSMTDYLQHLHSEEHRKITAKTNLDDLPWHKAPYRENSPVYHNDLPNKRIPIRGVQFLKPATAWFCSICKMWLGDLHCAANHVRGMVHSNNYNEFTSQNPHWEVDWITDRMRAYERKCGPEPAGNKPSGIISGVIDSNRGNKPLDIASISDQLMQMIAHANRQRNDSSEPQSSDSQDGDGPAVSKKSKKSKKKKSKKKKKEEDIVPPAAIVKTSARGKITINLPPAGGVASRSPEENEDIATTLLKAQATVKKSKHVEDSPDGLYDNINLAIRDAAAERQKTKSLLPASLSEYGDMNEDEGIFKKSSDYDSPRDMRYGPREPPRRDKRAGYSSNNNYPTQSHKSDYRYDKNRSDYSSSKERRSDRDRYDYGYKDKSPRSSKERHVYKDKKIVPPPPPPPPPPPSAKMKDLQKSPDSRMKLERESERKLKMKSMLDKRSSSPEEPAETVFEKRASESAAKKKDPKKALPKSKLPFIGRMPILKKKVEPKSDEPIEEEKKKEEKREMEFNLAEAMAKAEAAAAVVNQQIMESEEVPLPKSTLIISKRPRLTEPEVVKKEAVIFKGKMTDDNLTEQDMDIEDDHPKDELHKDFKDALDLLFPEDKKKEEDEDLSGAAKEVAEVVVEGGAAPVPATGYDVHSIMPPQTATPYDIGMYHPPAAAAAPPAPDQSQYIGYYDQSMYIHQAAYMMGGYDPNQGIPPQAYAPPVEANAQYMQQPPQTTAPAMPPPISIPNNSVPAVVSTDQLPSNQPSEHLPDVHQQESTGEDDRDNKESQQPKKKNPLSQRMRRHLKKKAEQQTKTKEENQLVEEQAEPEPIPPPPPTIKSFSLSVDKSDLAMLGIEEDDITAQTFM